MKFIDLAKIYVKAGDGGKGVITFHREKFVPKGGPDGGNGGRGGDIIFVADPHINTLLDFRYEQKHIAKNGNAGAKNKCTGRSAENLRIKVPCGTLIKDAKTDEVLADMTIAGSELVFLEGGKGGRGNYEFATATNQTPRYCEPGIPGKEMFLTLELKLIAEVGIVGLPNVGKSTLISVISSAKPKIADYPFTTLIPNLGIVKIAEGKSYTVADIPGLIEGASEGKGLGIQFLRHVERTKVLLFLIDSMSEHPAEDYKILSKELKKFNPEMQLKKRIIAFSRVDALTEEDLKRIKKVKFTGYKEKPLFISSITGENMDIIKRDMWDLIVSS